MRYQKHAPRPDLNPLYLHRMHDESRHSGAIIQTRYKMIDDDDSKIRRNLIVYCSLIVFSKWFGFSLPIFFSKIIGQELHEVDQKINTASIIVLLYLLLRFMFSNSFETSLLAIKNGYRLFQEIFYRSVVKMALSSSFTRSIDLFVKNDSLRKYISLYVIAELPLNSNKKFQLKLETFVLTGDFSGFYTLTSVITDFSGNECVSSSNEKIYFECKRASRIACLVSGCIKYSLFSKFCIELFLPLYLAFFGFYLILR